MTEDLNEAVVDILGAPFTAETIQLGSDYEGDVVATLVHSPAGTPTSKAVLYVHGFCDYFFQTGFAAWWNERGYDFYALDLRKYGRSIRPHQTPNFARDLAEYFPDLDAAWQRVTERDGHDHVVLAAHSTGGLTVPLWAADRGIDAAGIVLNSPWFDLQGSDIERGIGTRAIHAVGTARPFAVLPRNVSGVYGQSLHTTRSGEWDYDLTWKPEESFPVRFGWLSAIRRGHAALHRGLGLPFPALVLSSTRSGAPTSVDHIARSADIVLNVRQIRQWAHAVSPHLTLVSIPGGLHDLSLSPEPARTAYYDQIGRWLATYVD